MSKRKLKKNSFTIMTWNIFFGANLFPLINTKPEGVPEGVTEVFNQFIQSDFPARAKSIAEQIDRTKPDIIGLQEVALWKVQSSSKKRVINFLNILLSDLKNRGLDYRVIAVNKNIRNQLPSSTGEIVGLLDRDVILARRNSPLLFSNIQEDNFETNLVVPFEDQPFTILRGWSSVDVRLYDKKFRLVNTHLEVASTEVQVAQAVELIRGPGSTALPLIFIGDFNSNAYGSEAPTYDLLLNTGFTDAWHVACGGPGYTGVQARNLLNPISTLSERIDLILFRDNFNVKRIDTIGDKQIDRTPSGLWPSDHAGVVGILEFG